MKEKILIFMQGIVEGMTAIPEDIYTQVKYVIRNKAYYEKHDIEANGTYIGGILFLLFLIWI